MGWWGYGILDGDGPCDTLCDIEDAQPTTSAELMKAVGVSETTPMDNDLGTVIGFYAIDQGMEISDVLKRKVLESVESELTDAHRFNDEGARRKVLTDFRDQLIAYCDGQRVELDQPHCLTGMLADGGL